MCLCLHFQDDPCPLDDSSYERCGDRLLAQALVIEQSSEHSFPGQAYQHPLLVQDGINGSPGI